MTLSISSRPSSSSSIPDASGAGCLWDTLRTRPSITITAAGVRGAISGIDGGKRVKGIKRHIAVDRNGYPLGMDITTANVHDSRGADRLISCVLSDYRQITVIKADMGYRGAFKDMPLEELGISLECVRSNYGTSGFVPVAGRGGAYHIMAADIPAADEEL